MTLRVHPARIFPWRGARVFGGVHMEGARFLSNLSLLVYIGRVHGAISGCTVLGKVHPVSARKKSLISDTDMRGRP